MHQYTADLANRMVRAGHDVHLVTTTHVPEDRYAPQVTIRTPARTTKTVLSLEALKPSAFRRTTRTIYDTRPDVVHVTGPHLWNVPVMQGLTKQGIPVLHTLHDLHPHAGVSYGPLLYMWNEWVQRTSDHVLIHGQRYLDELLDHGVAPQQLTCTPLTFLFVSQQREQALMQSPPAVEYGPWALFFGRLEAYKGLRVLIEAARQVRLATERSGVVIAGPGRLDKLVQKPIPANVEIRDHLIGDQEALDLFSRCGLVVLPYIEASQSALIAAAYFFRKPVVVTRTGALPEYVVEEETGWIIPPNDPQALAEALQAALTDPVRLTKMGEAGHAWYKHQRRVEWIKLQEMYSHLARSKKRESEHDFCS
jgi:glycosyltransferase involved in cell wall biosynthesis